MFNEIVNFLARHYPTQDDLDTLVTRAFYDYPKIRAKIDLDGNPVQAATRLVDVLKKEGTISPGTQALWQLLLTARGDFGPDRQARIDRFKRYANNSQATTFYNDKVPTPPTDLSPIPPPISRIPRTVFIGTLLIGIIVITGIFTIIGIQLLNQKSSTSSQTLTSFAQIPTLNPLLTPLTATLAQLTETSTPTPTTTQSQVKSIGEESTATKKFATPFIEQMSPSKPLSQARLIAFIKNYDVYTIESDGSELAYLVTRGNNFSPAWSPDGQTLAFSSDREKDKEFDIYSLKIGQDTSTRLTMTGNNASPAWSPNGKRLAFASKQEDQWDIYVMDSDGSNVTRLTTTGNNYDPAWSPNGNQIAFESNHWGKWDIYVMDSDGSNVTRLTTTGNNYDPAWSPNGNQIAFTSDQQDNTDHIYVMSNNGGNVTRLTKSGGPNDDPVWSPDGNHIAFAAYREHRWDISMISPDGSDMVFLTTEGINDEPAWQPNH